MADAVIFPKLGQTMEEGAIVKWLKNEGDPVARGDILFEIETDKANLEVESFFEGVLLKIYIRENITVPVNTVVAYVGAKGEQAPAQPPAPPAVEKAVKVEKVEEAGKIEKTEKAEGGLTQPKAIETQSSAISLQPSKKPVSPRARALAHEKAINAQSVTGTGPNGRVTTKDVEAYLVSKNYDALRITPAAKRMAQLEKIDILTLAGSGDKGRVMVEDVARAKRCHPVAMSRMRQVIARRLTESKQSIPHFYVTVTADLTDLLKFRAELKAAGLSYSVNDFVLQAVVLSLEEFPAMNSATDGLSTWWRGDVSLGVAVSLDNGLVVPVIRAAQRLTLAELAAQTRKLSEKARAGKLTPDEMTGGSFTVSNMGMLNVDAFSAIINPGEAGILAVASARETPCVKNGEVKIRSLMSMTLSADHRIVDGATAAAFANAVRAKLEDTALWRGLV
ncbi:MAG: 2-oxo acid dehydrogenase subunit E2 [Kiritimatiellaeota bacterium]|nr:2-oxo acid dehydrogenase subunit E2 [Kiritimatiellota bacterium]